MKSLQHYLILLLGYTEVVIGLTAFISLIEAKLLFGISKPTGVFLFVAITSVISFTIGAGVLRYKLWARKLLMFFAGYIVLTKIFIFLGLLKLSPPFEVLISSSLKNIISLLYHSLIIVFLNMEEVRKDFIGIRGFIKQEAN